MIDTTQLWVILDNRHCPDMMIGRTAYRDHLEAVREANRLKHERDLRANSKAFVVVELKIK